MKPKISVCIPVYNGEKTLPRNLSSLISQNYNNFEIIISNNKSSDNTLQVCKLFKKKDSRIKFYNQKKKLQQFDNFKFLIKKSKGNYVMWLASHHKISKNFLLNNSKNLDKNSDFVASMGLDYFKGDSFNQKNKQKFSFEHNVYKNIRIFFKYCWRTHGLFYSLIRKDVLINASKSLKPYLAADWMFMINLIAKGKVCRTKDTYIVLGKEGNSSKKNLSVYVDKKYYSILPYFYFNKNFYKFINKSNKLNFFQKYILSFLSLCLNSRYLISIIRK